MPAHSNWSMVGVMSVVAQSIPRRRGVKHRLLSSIAGLRARLDQVSLARPKAAAAGGGAGAIETLRRCWAQR